jgi:hypothetical protein
VIGEIFNPRIPMQYEQHHIWCNYFYRDRKGCMMCERLFELYPYDNMNLDEMLAKYFPSVKKVG